MKLASDSRDVWRPPRPPRPSLSLVRGPPEPHCVREGGRPGVGCSVGGPLWEPSGFVLSDAKGSFVEGCAERVTCPPLLASLRRCPPNSTSFVGGRPRDVFGTKIRFRVPSCNSLLISKRPVAKRQRGVGSRGKPPNLGVVTNAGGKHCGLPRCLPPETRAGGMSCVLHNLASKLPYSKLTAKSIAPRGLKTEHPTPSLPPSRAKRDSGGPRTSESEGRGGREGRGARSARGAIRSRPSL